MPSAPISATQLCVRASALKSLILDVANVTTNRIPVPPAVEVTASSIPVAPAAELKDHTMLWYGERGNWKRVYFDKEGAHLLMLCILRLVVVALILRDSAWAELTKA